MKTTAKALVATVERWPEKWSKSVQRGIEKKLQVVAKNLGVARVDLEIEAS